MRPLDAARLRAELHGCRFAREIVVLETANSTSDVVAAAAREGAAEGLAVFAETQSAARGRLGRNWESAAGKGLWFSMLLRPAFPRALWTRLATWTAVATAEAIEEFVPCPVAIKWPNDLQIAGKKIAGMLIETGADAARTDFAVVGIGVNVHHETADFSPEIRETAGSLRLAAGGEIDRTALAVAMLRRLDASFEKVSERFAELIAAAEARSSLIGNKVRLHEGEKWIAGTAERLDENGALVLRLGDGSAFTANAGEMTLHPKSRG